MKKRKSLTPEDRESVRVLYSDLPTKEVAARVGRSISSVYQIAYSLGLKKSAAYLSSPAAQRLRRGDEVGKAYRFSKGHVPANKGLRRPGWAPGRMKDTQFKRGTRKGMAEKNWCPVGTIRKDAEGYLRIKLREWSRGERFGFGNTSIWPLLHRHEWVKVNGQIPKGHILVFRDKDRSNCSLENLELITLEENMRRNSYHRYGKEIAQVIQLRGAINRQINRRRDAEQNVRPS